MADMELGAGVVTHIFPTLRPLMSVANSGYSYAMVDQDLLTLLSQTGFSLVGAVLLLWAGFKWIGKQWLESQFSQRLESFKHAQNEEIERLRFRINALMDRTAKLHQHEFEVLPQVWDKLTTDFGKAIRFTSRMQSYPDLDRMNPEELEVFLKNSPLEDWQKNQLRGPQGSRNEIFQNHIFGHQYRDVQISHWEFHNYFIANGIFIQGDLKEKIRLMSNLIYDAFHEKALDKEIPQLGEGRFAAGDRLHSEGPKLQAEIEAEVQRRLWDANKLD